MKFLYDIFIEGEQTGKKKSPEEVEKLVRQHFASTDQYVTVAQIRAFFSTYSRKHREGALTAPTLNLIGGNDATNEDPENEIYDTYAEDLADAVGNAMSVLSSWEIGYWVVLKYCKQ